MRNAIRQNAAESQTVQIAISQTAAAIAAKVSNAGNGSLPCYV